MGKQLSMIDKDIDVISQRIMMELETASSEDLSEAKYAKKILQLSDLNYTKNIFQEIENIPSGAKRVIEKRAVIKALLLSTWLQRFYFIIIVGLIITRLFDTQIVKITKYIVRRLGNHKRIREFIMNHF